MDRKLRALNRFGLGARIGEARTVADPDAWLRRQLEHGPDVVRGAPDLAEIAALLGGFRPAQRARDQERLAELRRRMRDLQMREASALLEVRLRTEVPFLERLVAFWSNHLCVSVRSKRQVSVLAGHYERIAIRPHVLGRFQDMVLASARHPAMLFYLDNFLSVGPGSPVGRRTARRGNGRGLNENYARELLELHTLGVDGGYVQEDVEELARILTGWTISGAGPGSRPDEPMGFTFRPITHEPGVKTVLGRHYEQGEVREGEQVIRDLCAHPSTADFVATKLVRHFVADAPPRSAVEAIAATFRDTGGDLRVVAEALIDLDEAWDPGQRKFRTPQDWLVAVLRAFRAQETPRPLPPMLRQLRHPLWAPAAPAGYGDLEREWADPDALMNRAELARSLAGAISPSEAGRPPRFDPRALLDVVDVETSDPLVAFTTDPAIPVPERVALVIGGPAFQWR